MLNRTLCLKVEANVSRAGEHHETRSVACRDNVTQRDCHVGASINMKKLCSNHKTILAHGQVSVDCNGDPFTIPEHKSVGVALIPPPT